MKLRITPPSDLADLPVILPASKSFINRYQVLNYLSGGEPIELPVDTPEDVKIMHSFLANKASRFDVKDAGTVMRFGLAVRAISEGSCTIHGSGRMHERPILALENALRELGAEINYLEKEGFPPVSVVGRKLDGGTVKIDASVSSQFISALLLIGPYCKDPLILKMSGKILSAPYIAMTTRMMREFGANVDTSERSITVYPVQYQKTQLQFPLDWSAAAFFYTLVSQIKNSRMFFPGLKRTGFQGDEILVSLFEQLGVDSHEETTGITVVRSERMLPKSLKMDFTECPDLVQPITCACFGLGIGLDLSGLDNLRFKESNRLEALEYNLSKLGAELSFDGNIGRLRGMPNKTFDGELSSFMDHRMAMSVAAISVSFGRFTISGSDSVNKSFPTFWSVLGKLGFTLEEIP
ncbi:MAG: hypothetical protein RIC15_04570 [Vicingaceae bacterium]